MVLQGAWLPLVRPLGVVPNLALVVAVLIALENRAMTALVMGIGLGLGLDLISGSNFGVWTGTLVLEVLVAALVRRSGIETAGWLVPAVMVLVGTITTMILVLAALIGSAVTWTPLNLLGRLCLEILLNLGLIGLVRPVIRRVAKPALGDESG